MPKAPWIAPKTGVIAPYDDPKKEDMPIDQIRMKLDRAWIALDAGDDSECWKEVLTCMTILDSRLDLLSWEVNNLKEQINAK